MRAADSLCAGVACGMGFRASALASIPDNAAMHIQAVYRGFFVRSTRPSATKPTLSRFAVSESKVTPEEEGGCAWVHVRAHAWCGCCSGACGLRAGCCCGHPPLEAAVCPCLRWFNCVVLQMELSPECDPLRAMFAEEGSPAVDASSLSSSSLGSSGTGGSSAGATGSSRAAVLNSLAASTASLREEKSQLKYQLKAFDMDFKSKHGRLVCSPPLQPTGWLRVASPRGGMRVCVCVWGGGGLMSPLGVPSRGCWLSPVWAAKFLRVALDRTNVGVLVCLCGARSQPRATRR
jgi:hypothetical protein